MQTRGAWHKNLANSANAYKLDEVDDGVARPRKIRAKVNKLSPGLDVLNSDDNVLTCRKSFNSVQFTNKNNDNVSSTTDSDSDSSSSEEDIDGRVREGKMPAEGRPSLKLKLGSISNNNAQASSPVPQSGLKTPSIKLKLGSGSQSEMSAPLVTPKLKLKTSKAETNGSSAVSSTKKRKRQPGDEGDDEPATKQPHRKLTLKTPSAITPSTPAPIFKLKAKGKIPKRPAGVGYDSELEDREVDPVILEGFILRMPPGSDCDYVKNAIQNGTIGMHRAQGGADIRMRFLDTAGRRGIIIVNGNQYATTVVDLPCIIEGMKSWDKKGWIKSMDINQMMLVLGRCHTDDQAKNYTLPEGVDPTTFAYAHGLTAPMHWVRKRRFARTRRARVDDIESVERRVHQLIEADSKAANVSFQILNYNPELEQEQDSADDYDDEQDADGEDDDGYFARHNGHSGELAETPAYIDTPVAIEQEIDENELDEFEALFKENDADEPVMNGHQQPTHTVSNIGLQIPDRRDESSVAVTSASASPAAATSTAPTPAAENLPSDQPPSSDDDDSDADDDSDKDDAEKDDDENRQQAKERIADMENKIREQSELLKRTTNAILRRKLAGKIQALRDDVAMMKKSAGLANDNDGDDEDDD